MHNTKPISQLLIGLTFLLFTIQLHAQLNIKIGYSIGYMQASSTNKVIQEFNDNHSFYEKPLEDFKFLHGVLVGLRYRIDDVAVHFDWNNKFNLLQGSGVYPNDSKIAYEKLYFKNASFGLGLEFFGSEKISLGGTVDFDVLRYRLQTDITTTKVTIFNDFGWGSHFYLSLNIEGTDILTLNLQPYVQIPWSSFNIIAVDDALNNNSIDGAIDEKYLNFGLRIIFSNGSF